MFKKTVLAFLLITYCAAAGAAEPKGRGFYIGVAGGRSLYMDDGAFNGLGLDDEDASFQVHAGYKIFKHFAIEARHVDLGNFTVAFAGADIDFRATSVHAVGMIPFADSGWEIFGQLGFGSLNIDVSGIGSIDDDSVAAGGIGARFHPTPNLYIGIQTDVYVWEDSSIYSMGVGGTQLSINFIF